jgi:parvulin-like peptidyl-prolyl isomerase
MAAFIALIVNLLPTPPPALAQSLAASESDLPASIAKLDSAEQAALAKDPALLKQFQSLMRAQTLLLKEARKNKWEERPEVQAKMERARDAALAESWLQSVTAPPPGYPDDGELTKAYEERKASFATPRQYRLAQIFIARPAGRDRNTVKKAEAKLAAVKQRLAAYKENFSDIARAESEDRTSAENGGEIGWLSDAQIQPELRPAITRLLKHEVSPPVQLRDGWHILKCLDKRDAATPTLEEVRDKLTGQLRAEKTKANSEAYVARLLEKSPTVSD